MRIIVLLNPTNKRGTKTAYTAYRSHLLSLGFLPLQPEVYTRYLPTRKAAERLFPKLYKKCPSTGAIIAGILTEKQYSSFSYLTGDIPLQEREIGNNHVIIL